MGLVRKLKKVLQIPQEYGNQLWPEAYVAKYIKQRNPNINMDDMGNMFILNPGTPLLCAHMDTVQKEINTNSITDNGLQQINGVITVAPPKNPNVKKPKHNYNGILGGDDKCGVAMLLQAYEEFGDNISILFTTQEETGGSGSKYFCETQTEFLNEVPYCLVLDRRGEGDIIGYDNQYCSKQFEKKIAKILKPRGFSPCSGSISDADKLKYFTNCVNLSVGYENPHSYNEEINIKNFINAYQATCDVLESLISKKLPTYTEESVKIIPPKKTTIKPTTKLEDIQNQDSRNRRECNDEFDEDMFPLTESVAISNPQKYNLYRDQTYYKLKPIVGYKFLSNNPEEHDDYRTISKEEVGEVFDPICDKKTIIIDEVNFKLNVTKEINLRETGRDGKLEKITIPKGQYFFYQSYKS